MIPDCNMKHRTWPMEAGGGHLTHPAVRREKAVQALADLVRGGVIRQNPDAEAQRQHMQFESGPCPKAERALWLQPAGQPVSVIRAKNAVFGIKG